MFKKWMMVLLILAVGSWARAEEALPVVVTSMSALRAQMQVERGKETELQFLQLEVDRLKLEVEKRKTMLELGKMDSSGRNAGLPPSSDGPSSVILRYVFMAPGRKEAILDVDGIERRVQAGDDVGGRIVKGISAEGVALETKDGAPSFLSRPE